MDAQACLSVCRKIQRVLVAVEIYFIAGEKFAQHHFCIDFISPGLQKVHILFSENSLPHDFPRVVGQHSENFFSAVVSGVIISSLFHCVDESTFQPANKKLFFMTC